MNLTTSVGRFWRRLTLLAALLLAFVAVDSDASITVTKTNNSGATVNGSSVTQNVTFSAADLAGDNVVGNVVVAITFSKIGALGIVPAEFNEVGFTLTSPGGGSTTLIQNGAGASFLTGPWFTAFDDTVTFDQDAAELVNVDPNLIQAGTFRPHTGDLDSFNETSAVGTWTLSISDSSDAGVFNSPLTVSSWSVSVYSVPEPDSIGLWGMAALLGALIVFHRPRRRQGHLPFT